VEGSVRDTAFIIGKNTNVMTVEVSGLCPLVVLLKVDLRPNKVLESEEWNVMEMDGFEYVAHGRS
jgi:hypothetical protein